jgi:hypothetical protein
MTKLFLIDGIDVPKYRGRDNPIAPFAVLHHVLVFFLALALRPNH